MLRLVEPLLFTGRRVYQKDF